MVLSVDAAGFRADLLACAQQRRVFWEMLVEKAKLEWLFFNECQLVYPNAGRVEVSIESSKSFGPIFGPPRVGLHIPELGRETQEVALAPGDLRAGVTC